MNKTTLKALSLLLTFLSVLSIISFRYTSDNSDSVKPVLSQQGSRGSEVRQIQTKLKQLGYYKGSIDGIFGSDTKNAVISFQKNCGIAADGVAGPKTLLYLGLGSGSSSGGFSSN